MTDADAKPRAFPRGEERHFFDAAARGAIGLYRCTSCGRTFLPRVVCPHCWSQEVEPVDAEGTGTLYSYTVCRRAGRPGLEPDVPYVVALVDLDAGVRLLTNVVDVPPEGLEIGTRVRATFLDRGEGQVVPVFTVAS